MPTTFSISPLCIWPLLDFPVPVRKFPPITHYHNTPYPKLLENPTWDILSYSVQILSITIRTWNVAIAYNTVNQQPQIYFFRAEMSGWKGGKPAWFMTINGQSLALLLPDNPCHWAPHSCCSSFHNKFTDCHSNSFISGQEVNLLSEHTPSLCKSVCVSKRLIVLRMTV